MIRPSTPKKSLVIFDFDGTIADSFEQIISISNKLAPRFNLAPVSKEKVNTLRNLPGKEVIHQLGISRFKLPFFIRAVKKEFTQELHKVNIIPGIKDCVIQLTKEGHQLGIVTSNTEENVRTYLEQHGLHTFFTFIYSSSNIFGKHKVLKKVLKKHQEYTSQTFYVGDECRDIEAAHKCDIRMISVLWGFSSKKRIEELSPFYIAQNPKEIPLVIH
ncbi:HAD-IA family hydrolase [Algivirga pacifica]|uniref:HAD family hydrolase n=1 Tax=Algivirga pacifica TaxID=1162670 RepID=A0ABP9DFX4_9BACT